MERILLEHFRRYPAMEVRDMIKLLYQSEFGGGHMVEDREKALCRLKAECGECPGGAGIHFEDIGGGLCRIYLAKELPLSAERINAAFVLEAGRPRGSLAGLEEKFRLLRRLCLEGKLPFSAGELDRCWEQYRREGFPPVSHSEEYRRAYRPAYRVVSREVERWFPVLCAIDQQLLLKGSALVAVDGCSGSGKSHLGALLRELFDCRLFHMDDYFLRPEQRTVQRFSQPGGNLDYERFDDEVIQNLHREEGVVFRRFDCGTQALEAPQTAPPAALTVLEGVYSCHPRWRERLDLEIFLKVSPGVQKKRILARNGPRMLERFEREWIPLENRYFEKCGLPGADALVLDTEWNE